MRSVLVAFGLFVLSLPIAFAFAACSADDASSTADASIVEAATVADCAALPTDVTYACDPLDGGGDGAPTCSGVSSGTTNNQYPFGCTAITPQASAGQDQNGCTSAVTCTCQNTFGSEAGAVFVCPN